MKKITPFLWFNHQAEQAAKFYVSTFKDAKILQVNRKGRKVITVTFRLKGQEFIALNGGPDFKFTEAVSFSVSCRTQREIDFYWEKLSKGGSKGPCGWLKDRYGLSWQIVPATMDQLMWCDDPRQKDRVWNAMMKMSKLDIAALKRAAVNK